MFKFIKVISLVVIGMLFIQSCEYEWIVPEEPDIPTVVSYSKDNQPIFDQSCNSSGCHASGGPAPVLTADVSYNELMNGGYVNVDDPEGSLIYTSIVAGTMKVYAKPGDSDFILKWIEQGALDN